MTALQLLEATVRAEQHTVSRAMAKGLCRRVNELLCNGERPDVIYSALDELYHQYRADGKVIERDAIAEIMDWIDAEGMVHSA